MHCKNASHHSAYQSNYQASEIYYNETAKFTVTGVVFMRADIVLKVYFFFSVADLFGVTQVIWINF